MSNSPRPTRPVVPVDLILVGVFGLWAAATVIGPFGGLPGRLALGLVAILFAPGYALVAALFPTEGGGTGVFAGEKDSNPLGVGKISTVERLVLSVGLSVCLVPLIGLGLSYTPGGIRPSILTGTIGAMTMVLTLVAAVRRHRAPPRERFHPRILGSVLDVIARIKTPGGRSNLNVLLVIGLVVAGSGIGFAALEADRGEQFTEFYLLTEDPETGEAIAGEYPDEIVRGEAETIHVGITNNEGETRNYTVIVLLQRFNEQREIQEVERLDAYTVTVPEGETVEEPHEIRPEMTGEDLRVTYLLYTGSPPENTTLGTDNAYRHVHIWIDVPPSQSG